MLMIDEAFIVELGVVFDRSFDVMSDMRSDDIPSVFECDAGIFLFDDDIQFFKLFPLCFLD
jgi:hypothetical protein